MNNHKTYEDVFCHVFGVDASQLDQLEFGENANWDSVGHMNLIVALEEAFGIQIEGEDILDIISYQKGKEVLKRYNVDI